MDIIFVGMLLLFFCFVFFLVFFFENWSLMHELWHFDFSICSVEKLYVDFKMLVRVGDLWCNETSRCYHSVVLSFMRVTLEGRTHSAFNLKAVISPRKSPLYTAPDYRHPLSSSSIPPLVWLFWNRGWKDSLALFWWAEKNVSSFHGFLSLWAVFVDVKIASCWVG